MWAVGVNFATTFSHAVGTCLARTFDRPFGGAGHDIDACHVVSGAPAITAVGT